jgi:putative transposase
MPRVARTAPGDVIYHVLNRANDRSTLFNRSGDYEAFEGVMVRTAERVPMRLLAYCVMPNHWHLVLWPYADGGLATYMHRLTTTHARRWRLNRHSVGVGHVYQGIFKSFPIQTDDHLLTVCRYVERNPRRAGLVARAEHWRWSSAWTHTQRAVGQEKPILTDWPIVPPSSWVDFLNEPLTAAELESVRVCVQRSRPFGDPIWQGISARELGLEATLRPRGRPRAR